MNRRRTPAHLRSPSGRWLIVAAALAAASASVPATAEEIRGAAEEFDHRSASGEEFESRSAATDPLGRRSPGADAAHEAGARARDFGDEVGETGREIGRGAAQAGRTVGQTVRDAAVVSWYHVREAGVTVGRTVRDGSRAFVQGLKGER